MKARASEAHTWPVQVQVLSRVMQELASQGIDASALFEGVPVSADEIGTTHHILSYEMTIALIGRALTLARRPGFGLDVGLRERPADWGVVGYAVSCCPTLGDALRLGARYYRAAPSLAMLDLEDDGVTACWIITPPRDLGPVLPFVIEEEICAYLGAAQILTGGPLRIREAHFAYPEPLYRARYDELFDFPLVFSARANQIVFDSAILETPMLQANPVSAAIATRLCDDFLAAHPAQSDLAMRIRRHLIEHNLQIDGLDAVAGAFGMSPRTLRHRLSRGGESFQSILDSVRAQIATELLTTSPLKVEDVAERLGFSDARSFRRAFKQWMGRTPAEMRAAQA